MNADPHILHIASHVPGRLRVRALKLRGEGASVEIAQRIGAEPGVSSVSASALTGSLLIHYDPGQIQLDRLLPVVLAATELTRVALDVGESREGRPGAR